jgi:hypothetical protein
MSMSIATHVAMPKQAAKRKGGSIGGVKHHSQNKPYSKTNSTSKHRSIQQCKQQQQHVTNTQQQQKQQRQKQQQRQLKAAASSLLTQVGSSSLSAMLVEAVGDLADKDIKSKTAKFKKCAGQQEADVTVMHQQQQEPQHQQPHVQPQHQQPHLQVDMAGPSPHSGVALDELLGRWNLQHKLSQQQQQQQQQAPAEEAIKAAASPSKTSSIRSQAIINSFA